MTNASPQDIYNASPLLKRVEQILCAELSQGKKISNESFDNALLQAKKELDQTVDKILSCNVSFKEKAIEVSRARVWIGFQAMQVKEYLTKERK